MYRELGEVVVDEVKTVKEPIRNMGERIIAGGFIGLVVGLVFLIFTTVLHAILVSDDKVPHTDPMIVTIGWILSIIFLTTGVLVLAGKFCHFLFRVIKGEETL